MTLKSENVNVILLNVWTFNIMCIVRYHGLNNKLVGHFIVSRLGNREENHKLVLKHLMKELPSYKEDYTRLYENKI